MVTNKRILVENSTAALTMCNLLKKYCDKIADGDAEDRYFIEDMVVQVEQHLEKIKTELY